MLPRIGSLDKTSDEDRAVVDEELELLGDKTSEEAVVISVK
jgi:hypothetical protein